MGSKRLEQFQAAIQRLTDAKAAGLEAEIASAQAALNSPLPEDLTPQGILEAGKQRLGKFAVVVEQQAAAAGWIQAATAGIATAAANLEQPDKLGIPPEVIDAEFDRSFGIAAQTGQFFLDLDTSILVHGREAGRLSEAMVRLAGVLKPGEEISPAGIAARLGIKPSSASHALKRIAEVVEDGVVQPAGRGKYQRNPDLVILGEVPSAPVPATIAPAAEAGPPVTYSMKAILKQSGIAGVLSEQQARHLIQGLVASGDLPIGVDVVEGKAQQRGAGKKVVRDLELTESGLPKLRLVAEQLGAQGKIYIKSAARVLDERRQSASPAPAIDEEQLFWGLQVVADLKNVGTGALNTLQEAGILIQGKHFDVTDSGKRVYRPAAKPIVRKLDEAAAAAHTGRITRRFVLKIFGRHEEVKLTVQTARENPYGPNGPKAADNDLVEFVIARAMNDCLSPDPSHPKNLTPLEIKTDHLATEKTVQLAGEIAMRLIVLEARLGLGEEKNGDAKLYPKEFEALDLPEGGKVGANRLAAATIMELAQNARPFNFIRRKRPTYGYALEMVRGLKQIGRPDLIGAMAQNLAKPKGLTGLGEWHDGVKTINHASPLG